MFNIYSTNDSENDIMAKKNRKQIPNKTQRILFAQSAGICSMPDCNNPIIITEINNEKSSIAELAHIEAYNPDGARFNPNLSEDERNYEKNIIVVCKNCHKKIDDFPEIYTVEKLKQIKQEHITKIELLKENLINFDFKDLTFASNSILENSIKNKDNNIISLEHESTYELRSIDHKLRKNNLTYPSKHLVLSALTQQNTVTSFMSDCSKNNENFPNQLKISLKETYNKLKKNHSGDELFFEMYSQFKDNLNETEQAACLAIIVYFFTICELFEK